MVLNRRCREEHTAVRPDDVALGDLVDEDALTMVIALTVAITCEMMTCVMVRI